jgi:hypothetical protein
MKIDLVNFSGLQPKLSAHLLEDVQAQTAINARVDKGDLRAWGKGALELVLSSAAYQSLHQYKEGANTNWVYSANDCDFAQSPIANDSFERLYFTGESEPRAFANDLDSSPWDQTVDYYKFGAAKPAAAAAFVSGHTGGSSYRAYVYTYVTRYGEETGPSPVLSTDVYNTGTVVLDTFTQPPAGYALRTKVGSNYPMIRVYRTNTSVTGAQFQFVNEFEISTGVFNFTTGTFSDAVADADLGEVLPTEKYEGIDGSLEGLIGLSNGVFAGFKGNELFLSEPYQPHAWPDEYVMSFDYDIVGLGHIGTDIVIVTEGTPYMAIGYSSETMTKQRFAGFFPGTSKRSIVSTHQGVLYTSYEGLILMNHNGPVNVLLDYVTPQEWDDYLPNTMHGHYYNGKYFGWYKSGGTEGGVIFDPVNSVFTTVNNYHEAGFQSVSEGKFYTIYDDEIQEWEGDAYNYLYYTWKSKKFLLPQDTGFTCAQVIVDKAFYDEIIAAMAENNYLAGLNAAIYATGILTDTYGDYAYGDEEYCGSSLYDLNSIDMSSTINFKLFVDNAEVLDTNVDNDDFFRLPSGRGRRVEIQLSGYIPIRKVTLAQSPREL